MKNVSSEARPALPKLRAEELETLKFWEDRMLNKLFGGASAIALCFMASGSYADTSDKRIALSNNYAGNSWRQAMLAS